MKLNALVLAVVAASAVIVPLAPVAHAEQHKFIHRWIGEDDTKKSRAYVEAACEYNGAKYLDKHSQWHDYECSYVQMSGPRAAYDLYVFG